MEPLSGVLGMDGMGLIAQGDGSGSGEVDYFASYSSAATPPCDLLSLVRVHLEYAYDS